MGHPQHRPRPLRFFYTPLFLRLPTPSPLQPLPPPRRRLDSWGSIAPDLRQRAARRGLWYGDAAPTQLRAGSAIRWRTAPPTALIPPPPAGLQRRLGCGADLLGRRRQRCCGAAARPGGRAAPRPPRHRGQLILWYWAAAVASGPPAAAGGPGRHPDTAPACEPPGRGS